MNNITSSVNQSVLANSFGRSASSSSSTSALLQAANSQEIPDVSVFTGGQNQSLAGVVAQSLSEETQTLQAFAQLNNYSAAQSLLGAVYGSEGGTASLLSASFGAESGTNALLGASVANGNESIDQFV